MYIIRKKSRTLYIEYFNKSNQYFYLLILMRYFVSLRLLNDFLVIFTDKITFISLFMNN